MNKPINDISIVIIAADEEYAIQKCLESINRLPLINSEIICVDSSRINDATFNAMKKFSSQRDDYKLLKIIGTGNGMRSVARNEGFKASSKNTIFFIDGDIEINPQFIIEAIAKLKIHDCVTGDLKELWYDSQFEKVKKVIERRWPIPKEQKLFFTGGIFAVKRDVLLHSGLFNESMRCEDIELTLRISRLGYSIIQLPTIMGVHHTIEYSNRKRVVDFIKIQHGIYRGIIIRNNLFYPLCLFQFLKTESSFLWGILFYFFSLIGFLWWGPLFLFVSLIFFALDMLYGKVKRKDWFHRIYLHYITPVHILKGLFFCFKLPQPDYKVQLVNTLENC
ncbi:glycosyltransferase [uncultured Desulfobacter sp.]|uniref:glycosyltransferase n=1 Tax=uncultured Desulfobacter sp. TaxID=240139 RepID=UPI002AA829D9|nr:glycosyltransferase [uncultured Desulfobacter sp.]